MTTHPKELALMTEDLQPKITVDSTINESQFTIGWGGKASVHDQLGGKASVHDRLGGKASVHDQLGGRVNEESNDRLKRWLILWSPMRISCAEILNVDSHYN
jgi:hypothetical protein